MYRTKKVFTNWGKSMQRACILMAGLLLCLRPAMGFTQTEKLAEKRISIELANEELTGAIHKIEKKVNAHFMYDASELKKLDKKITGTYRNETVATVLSNILSGTGFGYEQLKEKIIIHRLANTPADNKNTQAGASAGMEDIVVRGRVMDEKGEPLIGVNIKSKHSRQGTVSDRNGFYTITLPADKGVLVFSFVGFTSREISVERTQVIDLKLMPDSKGLNEVVVTALGIKREEKALGYATTVVQGEQLTETLPANWTEALSGKVAGLNLVRSNAGPTGSNKIILRGENNLTGDNEALIVVDGVVINQGSGRRTGVAGESPYGTGSDNMPADYGTGLNDINPEDIAAVTVLKGPGAAALYGQRGANGAIIITTKSGSSKRKGWGITFTSNASLEQVNRWPDLQYEYGQGLAGADYYSYGASADGASTSGTSSAYGPKFDGQQFYQYDPVTQAQGTTKTPWVPYKNVNKYFNTGNTLTNTISLDGGTDKTTARFSFTNVANEWIVPNTGYKRNTVALSVNSKVNDKLQISSKINYTNKWSDNLPGSGYGNQSIMYWYIFWQPNANIDWLKNYWANGQEGRAIKYPYSSYPENPYAIAYEFINSSNRHGATGNVQAVYSITNELSLLVRSSVDFSYEGREQKRPYDAGTKYPHGSYRTQNIFSMEASSDFLLKYAKKVNEDFDFTITAGGSTLTNNYNRDEVRADSLVYPGIYTMANAAGPLVTMPWKSKYKINSFYGMITAGYKDFLFMDLTGRQDWNSVLASPDRTDNAGFFYPSLSMSFIPSQVWTLPKFVNFAKLRFSASSVGSGQTTPYRTAYTYPTAGSQYNGGLENPTTLANPDLRPLRTITYEAGANVKMLNNRLGFDLALYTGSTKDQILERIVDRASGYAKEIINVGKVNNSGIELAVNGTPLALKNFKWNTNIVFSSNRNIIKELADSSVVLRTGNVGGGQIVAKQGGSMGALYGKGYVRAPDGQIIYDANTGFALLSEDVKYLGNVTPKWKLGFSNDFQYKQFHLGLLFDAQYGAVAHSLMHYKMVEQGKLTKTLPGRYSGIIGNGVIMEADGKYRKNDVTATDVDGYYRSHWGADNAEGSTFSTDFVKFREARLDYTVNSQMLRRLGLQKLLIGIYGRNLYTWSKWPMFDPEFGTLNGSDIVTGFEVGQFPSTRSYGINLVVGL